MTSRRQHLGVRHDVAGGGAGEAVAPGQHPLGAWAGAGQLPARGPRRLFRVRCDPARNRALPASFLPGYGVDHPGSPGKAQRNFRTSSSIDASMFRRAPRASDDGFHGRLSEWRARWAARPASRWPGRPPSGRKPRPGHQRLGAGRRCRAPCEPRRRPRTGRGVPIPVRTGNGQAAMARARTSVSKGSARCRASHEAATSTLSRPARAGQARPAGRSWTGAGGTSRRGVAERSSTPTNRGTVRVPRSTEPPQRHDEAGDPCVQKPAASQRPDGPSRSAAAGPPAPRRHVDASQEDPAVVHTVTVPYNRTSGRRSARARRRPTPPGAAPGLETAR